MSKLTQKPTAPSQPNVPGRFERFNLTENPFPSEPVVNKDSADKRINGHIYEMALRQTEFAKIKTNFLEQSQGELNHLRLGYIMDESYIGRGNGKSAFLLNLQHSVNKQFCLDLSNDVNKCFAVYVTPEPGGRTKSFSAFVDSCYQAIVASDIITSCCAILRLKAIEELYPESDVVDKFPDEEQLIRNLCTEEWFRDQEFKLAEIGRHIHASPFLQDLPPTFPLFKEASAHSLFGSFVTQKDFVEHYDCLKKGKDRLEFVFSHLVRFFQAADFNGAYVLVDDFERIPDFQSARQKKDFALELRSVLFDGFYTNARIGFLNFLFVLHAGVPRLISDAWQESGMEARSPISQRSSRHVISFEKLTKEHVSLLLKKYLDEYRIDRNGASGINPFTSGAAERIGEVSEYNAARILKLAFGLLDKAAESDNVACIDADFVNKHRDTDQDLSEKESSIAVNKAETMDLPKKASGG